MAIVFAYLVFRLKWKELFHPLFILGLIISIAPVFIWIVLDKKVLFNNWLNSNFLHLLKASNFNVPWHYYIWAITTKYFYFLGFAVYGAYLAIKQAHKEKNYEFYLLIIWAIIFPVAFSFGRQKIHYFILPIYPATSLLAGLAFDKIFKDSVKKKIALAVKYIVNFASIIILCFPLKIQSKRFFATVKIAPALDQILKQVPEYEFLVYHQDKAALLFYSQELGRVRGIEEKAVLEDLLGQQGSKPKICYLTEEDFAGLNPSVKQNCQVILRFKSNYIIANRKDLGLIADIP